MLNILSLIYSLPPDPQTTYSINHAQSIANLLETYFTQGLFEMIIPVSFLEANFFNEQKELLLAVTVADSLI